MKTVFRLAITLILLPILAVALVLATVIVRAFLKPTITDEVRNQATGQFIKLSNGNVHYEYNRPENAKATVVMVHGITIPLIVWEKTVPALNRAGIATIRLDLFGRGISDRPKAKYNAGLYVRQITELLDSLKITDPVHIMGVSMGGAVSANVANAIPHRIASVTLIDPAVSFRKEMDSDYVKRRLIRGADAIKKLITNGKEEERQHIVDFKPYIREEFKYRGIEFTILSMALFGRPDRFIEAYRELKTKGVPVQLIWGKDDKVLPLELGDRLADEFGTIPYHKIDNAGHAPHYEQPDAVNPLLIDFILKNSEPLTPAKEK